MKYFLFFVSAITLFNQIRCLEDSSSSLLVNTTHGLVLGHFNEVGIREFKGIPYAKPPIGQLRFEYPVEPDFSSDIYTANFNAAGKIFKS